MHEGPTPERLALLREFLRTVALSLGGGDDPAPRDYARLAQQVRERPDATLLQTMMLRSMQQAIYTPHNSGHFGLAYPSYAHFTSPIRRYPDLLTHRVIKALLASERYVPQALGRASSRLPPRATRATGDAAHAKADAAHAKGKGGARARGAKQPAAVLLGAPVPSAAAHAIDVWEQYGALSSANERRADDASRDVEAWLKCQYMRERVGEQFAGRVTGVAPFGVFVTLTELYVDGMVHVSELGNEYFQYNEAAHELRGERTGRRFRLTDELHVQVSRVDLEARRIDFRLVPRLGYKEVIAAVQAAPPADETSRKRAAPKSERAARARDARLGARKTPAKKARGASATKRKRKR